MLSEQVDPWLVYPAVVRHVQPETPGVLTYTIELTDADTRGSYRAKLGQFNMLYWFSGRSPILLVRIPAKLTRFGVQLPRDAWR